LRSAEWTGNRDGVHQLPRDRIDAIRPWFTPELPGPVIFAHIRHSGVGRCLVDRWPDPRVVLAQTSGNYAIRGDPDAIDNSALDDLAGFVEAPSAWEPMLRRIDPGLAMWNRVVAVLPAAASAPPPDLRVRRLTASDTEAVGQLHTKIGWISDTWGGPAGLAVSGMPWAAFDAGTPVAVAVPFFVGWDATLRGIAALRRSSGAVPEPRKWDAMLTPPIEGQNHRRGHVPDAKTLPPQAIPWARSRERALSCGWLWFGDNRRAMCPLSMNPGRSQ
jgi:hypothetical protein